MKWKARTETTNIGALELGNLMLDENFMEVSIDICNMSKELNERVAKAVEIEKVQYSKSIMKYMEEGISVHPLKCSTVWSNKPVVMDFTYLKMRLEAGKPIDYSIKFGFHDAVDTYMEAWDGSITVDLSAHDEELKKLIIHAFIDKFF